MTNFTDRLYHMGGVPVDGRMTMGKVFFVRPSTGSDGNKGDKPNRALKTLSKALSLCTANKGDTVYLIAESDSASDTTDYQSAALDWNKDGVHLIGINGSQGLVSGRSRIAQLSTVKTIETLFTLSADNCYIANLHIFHGVASGTQTAGIAMLVSGQHNVIENCHIAGNGDTGGSFDDAGARSLKVSGDENMFRNCLIGLDTVIRATQTIECEISGGARNIFDRCMFNTYTSLTTFKIISCGAPDRFVLLKDCVLNAVIGITDAVSPTGAIDSGSVNGKVLLHNTAVYGCTNVTTADDSKTLVSGPAGGLVDMGLASAVDIA